MSATKENDLGGGGLGGYDDVDIWGLDEYGAPVGMGSLYGAMIGAGVGTLTAIGVRSFKPTWKNYSEMVGLAAGVLVGGVMLAFPGDTRHAGWIAMATAALNNGLRSIELFFKPHMLAGFAGFGRQAAGARVQRVPQMAGYGTTAVERLNGLGIQQVERTGGFGAVPGGRMQRKLPSLQGHTFNKAATHWGTSPMLMNQ